MENIIELVKGAIACSDTWLETEITKEKAEKLKSELKQLQELETKLQQIREYCEEQKEEYQKMYDMWSSQEPPRDYEHSWNMTIAEDCINRYENILNILNSGGAE